MIRDIKHDKDKKRFYLELAGQQVLMDYDLIDQKVMDMKHTFVPKDLRRKGLAEQVVKAGMEYARKHDYKIIPS